MAQDEAQAKQLDSVTDVVQEQEVDATRAMEAMSALSPKNSETAQAIAEAVSVSQEDVDLIVAELEVTEELARTTLSKVVAEKNSNDPLVVAALRKLVTS